jgi:hypothetical protein
MRLKPRPNPPTPSHAFVVGVCHVHVLHALTISSLDDQRRNLEHQGLSQGLVD